MLGERRDRSIFKPRVRPFASLRVTFEIDSKESVQADLTDVATPILEESQRREIIAGIIRKIGGDRDLDAWVEGSPLVEVDLRLWSGTVP